MSKLAEGQRVRIANRLTVGHSRVPTYARGAHGTVERVLREFLIPEDDAFGRPNGRRLMLYRVRLSADELWPQYRGAASDEVHLEVYENWLEAVPEVNP
jgi:Nitrile hydratase beta subunit